jgi:hypothetical protein
MFRWLSPGFSPSGGRNQGRIGTAGRFRANAGEIDGDFEMSLLRVRTDACPNAQRFCLLPPGS